MSFLLHIELIILSILFLVVVFRAVVRRKLLVQYALLWVILAIGMLVFAVVPGIADGITALIGIKTTSNFIYLLAILSLLILTFSLTVIVSRQSQKIKSIIQMVSIEEQIKKELDETKEKKE